MRFHRVLSKIGSGPSRYGGLEVTQDGCSYVWRVPPGDRCAWIQGREACRSDSIIQYTQLLFCNFPSETPALFSLGIGLLLLWLLYLFLVVATTADNFFCPSLSVIAKVLRLSESIAGVTILAFGNGAPDIFTCLVAGDQEMVIIFTELIAAGIFVTTIIAGTVALVAPSRIPVKSFTRDSSFYLVAVCWISYVTGDQLIELWEALSFLGIYMLFVVSVVAMQWYDESENRRKARIPRFRHPDVLKSYVDHGTSRAMQDRRVPIRSRAYSIQAKLDVAIATEMASRSRRSASQEAVINNDETNATAVDETPSERPTGLFREFLYDLRPISSPEWKRSNLLAKTILVLRVPPMLFLQLLIPVVNETAERKGWSRLLNCFQLAVGPLFLILKFDAWQWGTIGTFPMFAICAILGGVSVAGFLFFKTRDGSCPKYHDMLAFVGFASAMLIVYAVANEVMAVLHCIGYASGISDAMLGITLLAWGNSIGDLISNVAIARRGFPRMGYAACFGGPLFNTLLGLGLVWTIAAVRAGYNAPDSETLRTLYPRRINIRTGDTMPGCLAFLLISLATTILYLNLVGFVARRSYGYILYSLYAVFILINFLSELHFIHPLGIDHRKD